MARRTAGLDKETRQLLNAARNLGSKQLTVYLEDDELIRLCGVVAKDLNADTLLPGVSNDPTLSAGYYGVSADWFTQPQTSGLAIDAVLNRMTDEISDFLTYFRNLCELHKRRRKFDLILKHQAFPKMEQIVPRSLLEYGLRPADALASWMVWRKWLYDIDNRAAQETGYLFEPILAASIGGVRYGARNSPIRRAADRKKGRQVDCIDGKRAYEFKMRVTIAASGQGRFNEELEFAQDCQVSGYQPILLVLDPTPSARLTDLSAKFTEHGGEAYVGDEAWEHIEAQAGTVMATFVEKYVRTPLREVDEAQASLMPIQFHSTGNAITVDVGGTTFVLARGEEMELGEAAADESDDS